MKKSTSKFKPKIAGKNPSKAKAKKNAESILENLNKVSTIEYNVLDSVWSR